MSSEKNTVLAIFAHPDDELSCAGTMANHSDQGDDVHLAFLTKGENVTSIKGTDEDRIARRKAHTEKIEKLLGVTVHFMDFPDSKIEVNVEGGYKVASLIKKIKPNIVITWNKSSGMGAGHPDHRHTSQLVTDAISYARYRNNDDEYDPYREPINLYQYYLEENPISSNKLAYVDVSHQIDRIKEFINIYQEAYGNWNLEPFITTYLTTNGFRNGVRYAEVFQLTSGSIRPPKTLPSNPGFALEEKK